MCSPYSRLGRHMGLPLRSWCPDGEKFLLRFPKRDDGLFQFFLQQFVDLVLGTFFGAARGILLVALAIIGGPFAGFDNDDWWLQSRLIPHLEQVADWIKVMTPNGFDLLMPEEQMDGQPDGVPIATSAICSSSTSSSTR